MLVARRAAFDETLALRRDGDYSFARVNGFIEGFVRLTLDVFDERNRAELQRELNAQREELAQFEDLIAQVELR